MPEINMNDLLQNLLLEFLPHIFAFTNANYTVLQWHEMKLYNTQILEVGCKCRV